MYIQLTTKCSMSCDHCCFGCNTHSGEHMSMTTFRQVLKLMEDDEYPCLGGGEPTLHPNFREILIETIAVSEQLSIITNGSVTKHALLLAKLAKKGVITASLSADKYHDDSLVSKEVYAAFAKLERGFHDGADDSVCGQGSAVVNNLAEPGKRSDQTGSRFGYACACEGLHVRPDGWMTWCGCADAPKVGHVRDGWPETGDAGCCWHNANQEGYEEQLEQVLSYPINQTCLKLEAA